MRNILMLSYKLTLRTQKYAEYLPAYGYCPIVVVSTVKNLNNIEGIKTEISKNYLPLNILSSLLYRFNTSYRWLFLPDIFVTWIPNTLIKCWKIIKRNNVEVIYVSGGPFSAMLIGLVLKKMTDLPLIIDFRDPWSLTPDPFMRYPHKLSKIIDGYLEKKVMRSADHIIAVTNTIAEEYSILYPDLRSKIAVIPNGFDFSEFPKQSNKSNKFTITYTGSLYGSGTRPYNHLFKAINHIISNGLIPPDKIQVFIVGSNDKRIIKDIEGYHLQNNVYAIERLSQHKALEYTNSADMLLIIELTNAVTTKIYEYLSTGKPILAIIAKGELERLIEKYSDNSYIVTSESEDDIIRSILDAYNKWNRDALKNTDTGTLKLYCDEYNRKSLTGKLSTIFNGFNFHGRG